MTAADDSEYGLSTLGAPALAEPPELDYRPPTPRAYRPRIGLMGAGGITEYHLKAYRKMGLDVAAICDPTLAKAESRRDEFFPDAEAFDSHAPILDRPDIEVVDIATHPEPRVALIEQAIAAGKHILSQKPFVLDLETGTRLCDLADAKGVRLAVNQNGRWAPHFSYMRRAIEAGILGEVSSVDFLLHWDHTWTAGTPFEEIHHLLLFDFGIHWFDIATVLLGGRAPRKVYASISRLAYQSIRPPFLAAVIADYGDAQVRVNYNAHVLHGQEDRTVVAGSGGTIRAFGPSLNDPKVALWTERGEARPDLEGTWFTSGFEGAMGELLCAIEEDRIPFNNARDNLASLAFCFAALKSADTGEPVTL